MDLYVSEVKKIGHPVKKIGRKLESTTNRVDDNHSFPTNEKPGRILLF